MEDTSFILSRLGGEFSQQKDGVQHVDARVAFVMEILESKESRRSKSDV